MNNCRSRAATACQTPGNSSSTAPGGEPLAGPPWRIPAGITVAGSSFRSANVERDDVTLIDTYVLTEPALDLLHRVATKVIARRPGAWSVTGAYGTGKSSFAVLLAALLAPDTSIFDAASQANQAHSRALDLLATTDPTLTESLREVATARPMLRGLVTARREPVGRTIARALQAASDRRWGSHPPGEIGRALAALSSPDVAVEAGAGDSVAAEPDAEAVLHATKTLAAVAPLLLLIDEFGKNLEHFAAHAEAAEAGGDLYLLQELAELAAGAASAVRSGGPELYLLTLQHASFLDYAARTEALQRREWSKIQGRFHDVAFVAGSGDAANLVAGALDQTALTAADAAALRDYGHAAAAQSSERGLDSVAVGDPELLARTYPLHPLTLAAVPLLCGALGQHDRTLAGFVTGDQPHGVVRFLARAVPVRDPSGTSAGEVTPLHTLQLPVLWDYFATAVRGPALASSAASRWMEIETRLSEAHGLPELDAQILKTIAVLNLIDSSGCLRASPANIAFALTDPQQRLADSSVITDRLAELTERSFLTYRAFSDEYRLWRGSTIDLSARLQTARDRLTGSDVAQLIQRSHAPAAVVAGRHSQITGMLRHFETRVSNDASSSIDVAAALGPADGTVVFHLGSGDTQPAVDATLPVLIGLSSDAEIVLKAGHEVAALKDVLDTDDLDAPARVEVLERLTVARADLTAAIAAAFRPDRTDVTWQLRLADDNVRPDDTGVDSTKPNGDANATYLGRRITGARSLSALVSAACEQAYYHSPVIRNEMLGRHQLTSQGAKARRELLTALIDNPDIERAGITGHGPDRALYDGVVNVLGLHGEQEQPQRPSQRTRFRDEVEPVHGWTTPHPSSPTYQSWGAAIGVLRTARDPITVATFYRRLGSPPYGVKAGVLPIMLLAALVHTTDDVAIFDDGSFVPRLSADLIERMIKTPSRFTLRHMPVGSGQRRMVLDRLTEALLEDGHSTPRARTTMRNRSLLGVVIALLDVIRGLSAYAQVTTELPASARAVREALRTVRDPDELIFTTLPEAVGHPSVTPQSRTDADSADRLVTDLLAAVSDLRAVDSRLAAWALKQITSAFALPTDLPTARRDLAARARRIHGDLADSQLTGFLTHALREDLPHDEWLNVAVMVIARNPLASWRESDRSAFPDRVHQLARTFHRVYELYFDSNRPSSEPFQARRVTLTRPDGHEHHLVVELPGADAPAMDALVEDILSQARDHGDDGHGLLAALAERILDPAPEQAATRRTAAGTPALETTDPQRRRHSS